VLSLDLDAVKQLLGNDPKVVLKVREAVLSAYAKTVIKNTDITDDIRSALNKECEKILPIKYKSNGYYLDSSDPRYNEIVRAIENMLIQTVKSATDKAERIIVDKLNESAAVLRTQLDLKLAKAVGELNELIEENLIKQELEAYVEGRVKARLREIAKATMGE